MKKLLLLLLLVAGGVSTARAVEITLYYAVPSATVGTYTVKANIKTGGDESKGEVGDNWQQDNMTKTAKTFTSYDIYSYTYTINNSKLYNVQFQLYDGSTWESELEPLAGNEDISNFNGKMYVHDKGWSDYNYDIETKSITIHCKKTASWTPTNGYAYYWDGSADKAITNTWAGDDVIANANNSDYYDLTISTSINNTVVIFNNGGTGGGENQTWNIGIGSNAEYWTMGDEGKGGYAAGPECWKATTEAPEDWIGYTRSVSSGNYGTICLPYAATITGATIYKITSTVGSGESLTGINIESVEGNAVEAGKAYIFKATGTTLTATYSGSYTEASAGYGMMGNLGSSAINVPVGNYVISGNQIHKVVSGGSGVTIGQYKGYITLTDIPSAARGANFISFENETTGINSMDNGQLMMDNYYDLQGRRVAQPTKGLYIVNGKKVIK